MTRLRTYHRRRKTFLPAFNRKYWKRLIRLATLIVAERERDSWPPTYEEFIGKVKVELDKDERWNWL